MSPFLTTTVISSVARETEKLLLIIPQISQSLRLNRAYLKVHNGGWGPFSDSLSDYCRLLSSLQPFCILGLPSKSCSRLLSKSPLGAWSLLWRWRSCWRKNKDFGGFFCVFFFMKLANSSALG